MQSPIPYRSILMQRQRCGTFGPPWRRRYPSRSPDLPELPWVPSVSRHRALSIPSLHEHWLDIWLSPPCGERPGRFAAGATESLQGLKLSGTPVRKFALCLFPSLFAGAILTAVHWSTNNLQRDPGTWLLLYGCRLDCRQRADDPNHRRSGGLFVHWASLHCCCRQPADSHARCRIRWPARIFWVC